MGNGNLFCYNYYVLEPIVAKMRSSTLVVSYGIKYIWAYELHLRWYYSKVKNYVAFVNEEQEYRYSIFIDN